MTEHNEHQTFNKADEIPCQETSDPAVLSKNPVVSVHMITYNHESFIAQAIEGVLIQETDFPIELVIGEDCSTDSTREIVLDYQKKYPGIIKSIFRKKNVGPMPNFIDTFKYCKGKYIAICEGDDYWTGPYKLQKQVDFLEANPDFSICSHNVLVKHEGQRLKSREWGQVHRKEVITIEDVLEKGSHGATCSLVFRNKVFGEFPDWFYKSRNGDVPLQILCTSKGKMRYFEEPMGIYRKHGSGYSVLDPDSQAQIDRFETHVRTYEAINKYFNYHYDKSIRKHLVNYLYPALVRSYLHNAIRTIAGANKYVHMILKEDPDICCISFFEKIKYTVLIIVTGAVISLYKIAKRFRKSFR